MNNLTDGRIVALVDGELGNLDDPSAAGMQEAIAEHRKLRADIITAYGQPPELTVGDQIMSRLLDKAEPAPVIDLAERRELKRSLFSRRPSWASGAIAASLVAGISIGMAWSNQTDPAMVTTSDGIIVAHGRLADGLTNLMSADGPQGLVTVGMTFKSTDGYCRTFTEEHKFAGVACNVDRQWRIEVITRKAKKRQQTEYRLASSETSPEVMSMVDKLIVGDPLDTAAEKLARARNWQT